MRNVVVRPVLAFLLFAAACGDPTAVDLTPTVRFFNATTGMTGSGAFTANGQFATGSTLTFGQSSSCGKMDPGVTAFAFGAVNSAGTGLSGTALGTISNQSILSGGDYTVAATGFATSPTLFVLDNSFSGSPPTGQAAVRFVNLAPSSGTTVYNYVFYLGEIGASTPLAINVPLGIPSAYKIVAGGEDKFSALQTPGATTVVAGTTFALEAGSVNTIALIPNASGGFQLINLPRCS